VLSVALCAPPLASLSCAATAEDRDAPAGTMDAPNGDPASALRAALALERSGDVDAAAQAFAKIAATHAVISDFADLLRVRAFADAGRHGEAIAAAREADARGGASSLRGSWARLEGDAHAALGTEEEARAAWRRALDATSDRAAGAALRERIALSLGRSGDTRAAAALDREIWEATPTEPAARRAEERLGRAEETLGESLRPAESWDQRAQGLFDAGWTDEALVATDTALGRGLDGPVRAGAQRRRAHCLFRLRRYDAAADAFASLGDDGEARRLAARSRARAGRVRVAIDELLALAASGSPGDAAQAHWLAGLLLEGEGEAARARTSFEAVAAQSADPALASSALWRLGWADFRARNLPTARERLLRLAESGADLVGRLQARYWAARAAEESGDTTAAQAELARLAGEWGGSYYGWRARARLAPGAPVEDVPATFAAGAGALDANALARPRILVDAGLEELAREEIARLADGAGATAGAPTASDRIALARLALAARDYARAQALVLADGAEALQRAPARGGDEPFRLAYPEAYADSVRAATADPAAVSPALVWAIMREESGYRADVVSVAGARGLMQIMPETGARLARGEGIEGFGADDLFDPQTNIRLGAAYLRALTSRFEGRLSAAIGSYNAGPEPVSRWLAQRADWPDDAWVEEIPYDQTRNYVKRVLRSLHLYEALYGR
jgi:soluble lytic murein transglycosylase